VLWTGDVPGNDWCYEPLVGRVLSVEEGVQGGRWHALGHRSAAAGPTAHDGAMFHRLLAWVAWLVAGLVGGPGITVVGDPDAGTPAPDRVRRPALIDRAIVIGLALIAALVVGAPPAGVAVVAMVGLVMVLWAR
jgi:hypothetical protein